MGISISYTDVLYISDRVVAIDLNSNTNILIIGSGSGSGPNEFNLTVDLCVANTSPYVIDHNNARVQKTLLDGSNSSTVIGSTTIGAYNYLFVDHQDTIYIADYANHRIMRWLSGSSTGTVAAGSGTNGTSLAEVTA